MPKMKVIKVIDGDTIKGPKKTFVRLSGVDAPETGTKGAVAAKHELERLVGGKTVFYTEDAKSYGRTVGEVKIGNKRINDIMKQYLRKNR